MEDCTLRGFCRTLHCRQHTPQIPVQVCVQAHFQYVLENTTNPYVAMSCASPWLSMGMIRETRAQRSFLIRECDHGYVFECIQGKYKGKPFQWPLPKMSWGKDEGYANTKKMLQALRTSLLRANSFFCSGNLG